MRARLLTLVFAIALLGGGGTAFAAGPPSFVGEPPPAPPVPALVTPSDCETAQEVAAEVAERGISTCP